MMKRKLFFVLIVCLLGSFVSSAFAASTFKRVGVNPFYRPPLTSEADLRALVKSRITHIRTGFAKAGYPNLYRAFSEQFLSATIDSIKVSPGETFRWMLFRKKGSGPVIVTKDATWGGAGPLYAYRFYINSKGKRYEFAVLNACGNFALKNITEIPAPMPVTPEKAAAVPPAPMPATPEKTAAGSAASMSTAKFPGGPVADAGFSYQFDPASYLFARVGNEIPLYDKLSLIAFVGGSFRIHGKDGGSAFIADAILDYHWWNRLSFGLGAGYWSGNDGQMDLIANLGFLVYGKPNSFNSTLFLEARSEIGELGNLHDQCRFSLGMRFRF